MKGTRTELTGKITKIRTIKENGWGAFTVRTEEGELIGASGIMENPKEGEYYTFTGVMEVHPKYGPQMKIDYVLPYIKKTSSGIIQYLSGKNFHGIGKTLATRIVEHFGEEKVLDIIQENPERLKEIKGITGKKLEVIQKSIGENMLMFRLQKETGGSLTMLQAKYAIEAYGEKAVKVITSNPYKMVEDIRGIGFRIADKIAFRLGIEPESDIRVKSGIIYVLSEVCQSQGNCYIYLDDLDELVMDLLFPLKIKPAIKRKYFSCRTPEEREAFLSDTSNRLTIEEERILREYSASFTRRHEKLAEALEANINEGMIIYEHEDKKNGNGTDRLYWKELYQAEVNFANFIKKLAKKKPLRRFTEKEIDDGIREYEQKNGLILGDEQKRAVKNTLMNRLHVISGGPGRGKTTILDCVLFIWKSTNYVLCAPTGRAAQKMKEATGKEAGTIHSRIIEDMIQPGIFKNTLVIIDESSMLDIMLAEKAGAIFSESQITFVGDVDQLPSVGPGAVLRDLVNSPLIPTTYLTIPYRNSGNIITDADLINMGNGAKFLKQGEDFIIREVPRDALTQSVMYIYKNLIDAGHKPDEIGVLCAQKKTGAANVSECNSRIREMVNPATEDNQIPDSDLRIGDRVMQVKNRRDKEGYILADDGNGKNVKMDIIGIYNGDCGQITAYDKEEDIITMRTDDGRYFKMERLDMNELVLAYAMTIHKSQGSEYQYVILPFSLGHYVMLKRNILYTAITRAKKRVFLLGEAKAVDIAARDNTYNRRNTELLSRISGK